MEHTHLKESVFEASQEINQDDINNNDDKPKLSIETITKAKILAGRARRRSFFDFDERPEVDAGKSMLSHADFPASPPKITSPLANMSGELSFDKEMIYEILEQEMNKKLSGKYYDNAECELMSKQIATSVKERIAALNIKTFKIVCICYVTKRGTPSMKMDSGCAWDELITTVDKDAFVDCVFQNEFLAALGTVYGVCCRRVPRKSPRRSSSFPKTRASSLTGSRFRR